MNRLKEMPIPYMERTRDYYLALGYDNPYVWAHFEEVPFAKLKKPLSSCRISLVTTAAPYQPNMGPQGPGAPYNSNAKFYDVYSRGAKEDPDVRVSHVAIDRDHTTAEDKNTWFPLDQLKRAATAGRIGGVAASFHGLPTNRSQKTTEEIYCPDLLRRVEEDQADIVVLVPNCPVCHQSVSLAARHLEENGVPTVIMGCAKDIVEHVGVPRFLYSDFPLGNSAGKPNDLDSQIETLELALELLEIAEGPRETRVSPIQWGASADWKMDYSNAAKLTPEEIAIAREKFDHAKDVARKLRE